MATQPQIEHFLSRPFLLHMMGRRGTRQLPPRQSNITGRQVSSAVPVCGVSLWETTPCSTNSWQQGFFLPTTNYDQTMLTFSLFLSAHVKEEACIAAAEQTQHKNH